MLLTMRTATGRTAFNQLQSNTTLQTTLISSIGPATGNVYAGAGLVFNPPVIVTCLFPGPPTAICDSSRGVWVIETSVSVTNVTYTFINPTEVRGDFVSSANSTVVLSYQPPSLTVTGCVKFGGTLILSGPPVVVTTNTTYLLATYASLCPTNVGDPAGFSTLTWQTEPQPEKPCQTVSSVPQYGPTSFSVLVNLDLSRCNSDGAVAAGLSTGATAGIAVGIIAVVAIAIIVVVLVYRRTCIPKPVVDKEMMALAATDGDTNPTAVTPPTASKPSKKGKNKKGETEYGAINLDEFNAGREASAQIVSIPAADVKMLQRLGSGAYGEVWLGSMPDGAFVAVKRLKNTVLAAHARAFFAEAAIMMQITDEPHVVQMYGMIADSGEYGLVMEFMPGGSLETYLTQLKTKTAGKGSATSTSAGVVAAEAALLLRQEARLFDLAFSIASGMSCLAQRGIGACASLTHSLTHSLKRKKKKKKKKKPTRARTKTKKAPRSGFFTA